MAGVHHPQNTMKVCYIGILQPNFWPDLLMLYRKFDPDVTMNTKASVHLAECSFFKFYDET